MRNENKIYYPTKKKQHKNYSSNFELFEFNRLVLAMWNGRMFGPTAATPASLCG
jgi:hypothetical protein